MSRRLFTEHLFEMEKNAFLLDVIQARASAILQADSQSNSLSETALVLGVNTAYIEFVLKIRDENSNVDFESLCQLIYDKIYEEDWKRTARFKKFDEKLLELWCDLKAREKEFREGHIALDAILADAKHAYWAVHGKDIEWHEIEEKPEQLEETEPEREIDIDSLDEFEVRLVREKLLCEMFKDGAVNEQIALQYMGEPHLCYGAFLKIVEMHTETESENEPEEEKVETEPETEGKDFDFFKYHKQETEAKLLCQMFREGVIDEKTALEYIDEPSLTHEDFLRIVDTFAEQEERDDR